MGQKAKKKRGKRKGRIMIIAAILVIVFAAGYTVFVGPLREKEEWIYKEALVQRGTLTVGVTESGALEFGVSSVLYGLDLDVADGEDEDAEAIPKFLQIAEVYVAAGQRVEAGTPLLKFEESSISGVRRILESARIDAVSEHAEAENEYALSVLKAETALQTSAVAENYASSIYDNAAMDAGNQIAMLQIEAEQNNARRASLEEKVLSARENYEEALKAYTAAKNGMDAARAESITDFVNAQSRYQSALSALNQAERNLEDNDRDRERLTRELDAARLYDTIHQMEVEETYLETVIKGENAKSVYQAKLESLKETLAKAEDKKNQASLRLQDFDAFVGTDGILYAPETGIITEIAYQAGDRLTQKGAILSYTKADVMSISVDVTQEDVVELAVGDRVDICFKADPSLVHKGVICSIDTTATARNSNTISYTVVISVLDDTSALYGGMTADVIFVKEKAEDVLYVSRKAITEQDGKTYVYKKGASDARELTEVKTGISNGVYVEIVWGLQEGDVIYLASRVNSVEEIRQSGTDDPKERNDDETPEWNFRLPESWQGQQGAGNGRWRQ